MEKLSKHNDFSNDLMLIIDILADMIFQYIQTEEANTLNEGGLPNTQPTCKAT